MDDAVVELVFSESHKLKIIKPSESAKGSEWDVVLIRPGISLNKNFYSAEVLKKAAPLFEGAKACAYRHGAPLGDRFDHVNNDAAAARPSGFAENVVGFFKNVRYGTFTDKNGKTGEGILARFHVLEGHEWLRKNLKDAWEQGKPDLLGFSIDAKGSARDVVIDGQTVRQVEEISEVRSTDIVTDPAAGGAIVRLVASIPPEISMEKLQAFYTLLKEHRASWLKDFAQFEEGSANLQDYLVRVLEANVGHARKVLQETSMDEVTALAEVTRGVKALESLVGQMKGGKADEATSLLQAMIESVKTEQGKSAYSYPYKKHTDAGTPPQDGASVPAATKETIMDQPINTPELSEAEKQRVADLDAREKAMAKRERDAQITEKVKASDLPELAKARMIETLCASEVDLDEAAIDAAITKEAEYISGFNPQQKPEVNPDLGGAYDQQPAQDRPKVEVKQDQRETWSKAFDGMFANGLPVDGVQPFRSIHEAFGKITGRYYDREEMAHYCFAGIKMALPGRPTFNGVEKHLAKLKEGYNPYRYDVDFKEAIGTGDYPIAFGDSLFRRLQKEFDAPELNDWRQIISSIENLTDLNNDFNLVRIGYTGVMPTVPEKGPYQEVNPEPTEDNEKLVPAKHGFLLKLTWEDMLADRIGVIRRIPSILGRSSARTIQQKVWDQIETNPVLDSDSVALINATHNNLVTGSPTLSFTAVTDAIRLLRNQQEQDSLEKLGLNPAFLLVSPTREQQAVEITGSNVKVTAAEDSTVANFVRRLGVEAFPTVGLGRTTGTNEFRWYVAASPKDVETIAVGFLGGRDRPDLFVQSPVDTPTSGASFESDALTFKIRLGVGAKVADFRWIAGSLATT